jgi:hypothetical protein
MNNYRLAIATNQEETQGIIKGGLLSLFVVCCVYQKYKLIFNEV